jgi:hypothetical protein
MNGTYKQTLQIKAGIEELNGYVDKMGASEIRWKVVAVHWGV